MPPVQVITIVGKVVLTVTLKVFWLAYEHPIGAKVSEWISVRYNVDNDDLACNHN